MNTINELRPDLLASGAMQPWPGNIANAREQMFSSHLSQALVLDGCTTRRVLTGAEREFGKLTFSIKLPVDAEILRIIPKYRGGVGRNAIRGNPLDIVIYENLENGELGILQVPQYSSRHQHYGFRYKRTPIYNRIMNGMSGVALPAGTILADSPAIDELGNYRIGVESNVAYMTVPGVTEDGVVVSRDYIQKLVSRGYETRVASWGNKMYPLNLYGNDDEYKPFPDIGDRVRSDGLIFALRKYDDLLAAVQMTPHALTQPDYSFDELVYGVPGSDEGDVIIKGQPGARVVDISVRHDIRPGPPPTPVGMEVQTQRYYEAQMKFYDALHDVVAEQKRKRGGKEPPLSREFHALLVEGKMYRPPADLRAVMMYQLQPLDDWRVEVTYEYDVIPTYGSKLTGFHGNKGVICDIRPTEDMPVDEHGNRADLIMDPHSMVKRMNPSCAYEQHINAASLMVTRNVRRMKLDTDTAIEAAWNYIMGYYKIVSPEFHQLFMSPEYGMPHKHHVDCVVKDGVYLWYPTDNPVYPTLMILELQEKYPVHYGPVTYRGNSGKMRTTVSPILIGSSYVMVLEKTGVDCSGVSSAKLNHFGIAAKLTKADKYGSPRRPQPVRGIGESEGRLMAAVIGGEATAEILERSNSPQTHKNIATNILMADKPTALANAVDRSIVPRGGSRSLTFIRHALECAGCEFYYESTEETIPTIYPPEERNAPVQRA